MESIEILRTIIMKRANQLLKHGNAMVVSKKNDFYIFMKTYIYSTGWYKQLIGIS